MTLFSSLTNRIFMGAALLAVVSIGFAIYVVNRSVTREAEEELRRGLNDAGTLVDQYRATLFDNFTVLARLIADLPKLKAAVDTGDAPTVQDIAEDYQKLAPTDLFVVTDKSGRILGRIGSSDRFEGADVSPMSRALKGEETSAFWPRSDGVLQVVTLPIYIERPAREILGTLSVGFLLGDRITAQFKSVTESEIAWVASGRVLASTLPPAHNERLAELVRTRGSSAFVPSIDLGGEDYVAMLRPLVPGGVRATGGGATTPDAPVALLLRSRTERLRFLNTIHTALAVTAVVAVLFATVLSYAIARTVTRPLGTITGVMRDMADTGDLTRKIALRRSRWDDEDARLLASTFNTLTDSIARFQREAAQRERLSSLGRLSTVIAHEIRNPLMIMKASLRTVRREDASQQERAEAAADIDEEITRLNRVVNDVLDFARPIRFECHPADLNALCREAAAAAVAVDPLPAIHFVPDPSIGAVTIDAERVRLVLVNMLTNARHAVLEREPARRSDAAPGGAPAIAVGEPPAVELHTERLDDERVAIVVRDRGKGIAPQDLARVFDPYFTTKRTGSGLGLPIAKNVIEGLGGSIGISSRYGEGTEIRLVLPRLCRSA